MIGRLIKYTFKYTAMTLFIGYLTYNCHNHISKFINNIKFYTNSTEDGFINKNHGFDLKIDYQINGKGNLETYVRNYSNNLPIFERANGIMIGSSDYNFSNLNYDEASRLCNDKIKELSKKTEIKPDIKKKLVHMLYDLLGDESGN